MFVQDITISDITRSATLQAAAFQSCDRSRMRTQAAASRRQTMPLLALNRKDTGWRIDWQIRPLGRRFDQLNPETLLLWRYRGRVGGYPLPERRRAFRLIF